MQPQPPFSDSLSKIATFFQDLRDYFRREEKVNPCLNQMRTLREPMRAVNRVAPGISQELSS
jgi:hypothetical protein